MTVLVATDGVYAHAVAIPWSGRVSKTRGQPRPLLISCVSSVFPKCVCLCVCVDPGHTLVAVVRATSETTAAAARAATDHMDSQGYVRKLQLDLKRRAGHGATRSSVSNGGPGLTSTCTHLESDSCGLIALCHHSLELWSTAGSDDDIECTCWNEVGDTTGSDGTQTHSLQECTRTHCRCREEHSGCDRRRYRPQYSVDLESSHSFRARASKLDDADEEEGLQPALCHPTTLRPHLRVNRLSREFLMRSKPVLGYLRGPGHWIG